MRHRIACALALIGSRAHACTISPNITAKASLVSVAWFSTDWTGNVAESVTLWTSKGIRSKCPLRPVWRSCKNVVLESDWLSPYDHGTKGYIHNAPRGWLCLSQCLTTTAKPVLFQRTTFGEFCRQTLRSVFHSYCKRRCNLDFNNEMRCQSHTENCIPW